MLFPKKASYEGAVQKSPLPTLSCRAPFFVLPSDSEASLACARDGVPPHFVRDDKERGFRTASPGRPLGLRLGATAGGLAQKHF